MKNIQLDMIVETKLSVIEFNKKFIEWVEFNNWTCGGIMIEVDDDGNKIKKSSLKQTIINQQYKLENAKHLKDVLIILPEVEDNLDKNLFDNEDD